MACAEVVKNGPHRTVYRVPLASGTVYVKHCRLNGPRAWAREVMRPPKARLEFENAMRLRSLGIGAAIPLAWGTPDSLWPGESYLITQRSRAGHSVYGVRRSAIFRRSRPTCSATSAANSRAASAASWPICTIAA